MKNYIWIIVLLALNINANAQESLLSKSEAINLALEQNFGIKVAENTVEIADNNQGILNTGFLPILSGAANASFAEDNNTIEFPGQVDENGNPRPDVEINNAETKRYGASLNLNYTLFDGLGRTYNYKRLKEQYQLTELQARETIQSTILQLLSIYFEVARLSENEFAQKEALEVSKDRIKRAQYSFEYGQNTQLDVLNAEVDVTNDSIILLNTQQLLENTKRDLNVVLNQDMSIDYAVDTLINFIPMLEIQAMVDDVSLNNLAILQTERNLAINEYDIKVSKSGYLPVIGLTGSYGWNLNQNPASAFFPGTINNNQNFTVAAGLTWNLFDGGNTTVQVRNAKILYENQELLKKQVELEVERDIQNALETYKNRLAIYEIQEKAVITNQNNFERSREQYQLGRITSIEFRQAQINLLTAQTTKNLAKYDAKLAELQLLDLTGQLLNVDF
jgi:outer membrane protein TolC